MDYESLDIANEKIKNDGHWAYLYPRFTVEGLKEIYRCNKSMKCKKLIYILRHPIATKITKVSIWSNKVEHTHDYENKILQLV